MSRELPGRGTGSRGTGGGPPLPTVLSFAVLGALAAVLVASLVFRSTPPVWVVALLLLTHLGLRVWRARLDPRFRRPGSWLIDVILIGLLLLVAGRPA